jgi:hypothetical protein
MAVMRGPGVPELVVTAHETRMYAGPVSWLLGVAIINIVNTLAVNGVRGSPS